MKRSNVYANLVFFLIIFALIIIFPDFGVVIAVFVFGLSTIIAVLSACITLSGSSLPSTSKAKTRKDLVYESVSGSLWQGVYIYVVLSNFWNPLTVIASSLIVTVSIAYKSSNIMNLWDKLKK